MYSIHSTDIITPVHSGTLISSLCAVAFFMESLAHSEVTSKMRGLLCAGCPSNGAPVVPAPPINTCQHKKYTANHDWSDSSCHSCSCGDAQVAVSQAAAELLDIQKKQYPAPEWSVTLGGCTYSNFNCHESTDRWTGARSGSKSISVACPVEARQQTNCGS